MTLMLLFREKWKILISYLSPLYQSFIKYVKLDDLWTICISVETVVHDDIDGST